MAMTPNLVPNSKQAVRDHLEQRETTLTTLLRPPHDPQWPQQQVNKQWNPGTSKGPATLGSPRTPECGGSPLPLAFPPHATGLLGVMPAMR